MIDHQYLMLKAFIFIACHSLPTPFKLPGNYNVFGRNINPIGRRKEIQNLKYRILMQK